MSSLSSPADFKGSQQAHAHRVFIIIWKIDKVIVDLDQQLIFKIFLSMEYSDEQIDCKGFQKFVSLLRRDEL